MHSIGLSPLSGFARQFGTAALGEGGENREAGVAGLLRVELGSEAIVALDDGDDRPAVVTGRDDGRRVSPVGTGA